ncbi:MAG: GTP-binding protein, partial [Novosphingobium sp.]
MTGYLGSGKTTLIADLLSAPGMQGSAVIVNELAEVGIDKSVIDNSAEGEVVLLSNGCLCCGRGADLAVAVRQLVARSLAGGSPIDRILIETSGVADPGPIVRQICFDPQLRSALRYGGILCLFDTAYGNDLLERDPVGYRQIALADMVLLTKTDLSGSEKTGDSVERMKAFNPGAVVTTDKAEAHAFLTGRGGSVGKAGSQSWLGPLGGTADAHHVNRIGTWTVRIDSAIDWPAAEGFLRGL